MRVDTVTASQEDFVHTYSQKSLQYIRKGLNLPENPETIRDNFANPIKTNAQHKMALFGVVASKLRSAMNLVQRERFYHELEHFIRSVEEEHIFRLRGAIPSIEKYSTDSIWFCRISTFYGSHGVRKVNNDLT